MWLEYLTSRTHPNIAIVALNRFALVWEVASHTNAHEHSRNFNQERLMGWSACAVKGV